MRIVNCMIVAAAVAALATSAMAGDRVDNRQVRQRARIAQGADNGSLTKREDRRLVREQRAINRMEKRANADGTVTPRENRRIAKAQNRASRDIYRQKHDGQIQGDNRIDARQENQRDRIRDGVKDGTLTRHEARRLAHEQRAVNRAERAAEADGKITPGEQSRIDNMQDRTNADIYKQKHDDQNRPSAQGVEPAPAENNVQ